MISNVKSETDEIGDIVSEDSEQRTENSKTFLLDDGTKMFKATTFIGIK